MAKKSAVSQYLAQIGREGGKAKVRKGLATLTKKRKRARSPDLGSLGSARSAS
jgi:hypothetical protein